MSEKGKAVGEMGRSMGVTEEQLSQLDELRRSIIAKARQKIDPNGIGLDAVMQGTDDGGFFGVTEEQEFQDWLDWAEQVINVVSLVSQRISLAVVTVGLAFVGSTMAGNERTAGLGDAALAVSGVFAIWFVVSMLTGVQGKG